MSESQAARHSIYRSRRTRRYELFNYDLWGNDEDGWTVNDVIPDGCVDVACPLLVLNAGMPGEAISWPPSDAALSRAVSASRMTNWDGEDDYVLYAELHGKPLCELRFEGWLVLDGRNSPLVVSREEADNPELIENEVERRMFLQTLYTHAEFRRRFPARKPVPPQNRERRR